MKRRVFTGAFPCVSFLLAILPTAAGATTFYVDPQNGSPAGDGSRSNPWKTLQQVIEDGLIEGKQCQSLPWTADCTMVVKNPGAPIKAGDTIRLLDGYHGEITLQDAYMDEPVTVEAEPGHTPRIKNLRCLGAGNWIFRGLSISPSHVDPYSPVSTLVMLENHNFRGPCRQVTVENCTIYSVWDTSGWSADDWNQLACSGIQVQGPDCQVINNYLRNVDFGISVSGPRARVVGNTVENFSGDGLRGIGDFGLFERNLVMNCYDVNANHDDGFQSWSTGPGGVGTGEVHGVVLRANTIINYTDPNQPHRGTLQGIGCFDGFYVDWVVENNVIITDHWHGITFLGARNVRVVNNTVVDINEVKPGPTWIRIGPHKDGTPSEGCLVRNNITMSLQVDNTVTEDHNLVIDFDWARSYFVDYAGYDLHLTADSPAIDAGSSLEAPPEDHDGVPRPQGAAVDMGAYEWTENPPSDGGTPDGGATDGDALDGGGTGDEGADAGSPDGGQVDDAGHDGGTPGDEPQADAGADGGGQQGGEDTPVKGSGCGCAHQRSSGCALALLVLAGLLTRRRSSG